MQKENLHIKASRAASVQVDLRGAPWRVVEWTASMSRRYNYSVCGQLDILGARLSK
jgi:hypothetical protein